MSTNEYMVGQVVDLAVLITNRRSADAPIDDSSAAVTVYQPDGTTSAPTPISHGATGEYFTVFIPTMAGPHEYVWSGTAVAAGKGRGWFYVSPVP